MIFENDCKKVLYFTKEVFKALDTFGIVKDQHSHLECIPMHKITRLCKVWAQSVIEAASRTMKEKHPFRISLCAFRCTIMGFSCRRLLFK